MSYEILAKFDMGEKEKNFDLFLSFASEEGEMIVYQGLEAISERFSALIEKQDDQAKTLTKSIMQKRWFWTFSPELGWVNDRENNQTSVAIDWHLDSEEHIEEIANWVKAFGALSVEFNEYNDDFEE